MTYGKSFVSATENLSPTGTSLKKPISLRSSI
jgi:hypothetical protein